MKKVLGLDLGVGSIGWCLLEKDDNNVPIRIVVLCQLVQTRKRVIPKEMRLARMPTVQPREQQESAMTDTNSGARLL